MVGIVLEGLGEEGLGDEAERERKIGAAALLLGGVGVTFGEGTGTVEGACDCGY